ncbi:MAG TPA: hypothetical protein RMH99_31990 [Sandaracinaceae bacterium LLY-WYZ-13_1]|nr:hypothetical protein [Sandaracinaceae bacterium LLY-WYZ-13_1]
MTQAGGLSRLGLISWLLLATALGACGEGGTKRGLSFEIAAEMAENPLAGEVEPCTTIEVYRRDGTERGEQIQITRVQASADGMEPEPAYRLRLAGRTVAFDVDEMAAGMLVDLEIRVYDGDQAPVLGATVIGADLTDTEDLRVRLYPFGEWAPAAPPENAASVAPRALHAAVPLPNGDVLVFGGVRGTGLNPASVARGGGARLQSSVELYDASAHRFETLSVQGPDGASGFERVLFAARYVGEEPAGEAGVRHRIRVIGGLTRGDPDQPTVLDFDTTGFLSPRDEALGEPLQPARDAATGDPVDLVYTPGAEPAVVIEPRPGEAPAFGAATSMSEFLGGDAGPTPDDAALVLFGFGEAGGVFRPTQDAYVERRGGDNDYRELLVGRLGATVNVVPELGGFLVWGGNVGRPGTPPAREAGELHLAGAGAPAPLDAGGGVPASTAFHSATRLPGRDDADPAFLLAGGYLVDEARGTVSGVVPDHPLRVLEVGGPSTAPALGGHAVDLGAYQSSIFHSATAVPELGVVLVGGAVLNGTDRLGSPSGQTGVVAGRGYAGLSSGLETARWGHTATVLPGRRLLVVGGFRSAPTAEVSNALEAFAGAEMLYYQPAPAELRSGRCGRDVFEPSEVDVLRPDASLGPPLDTPPPPPDDAGVPPTDAGMPPMDGAAPPADGG